MTYRMGFIGAGKVAWHLAPALQKAGHQIGQVISRSALSAQKLGEKVNCSHTDRITNLDKELDMLFLTVGDGDLVELINDISDYRGLVIHTSGTFSSLRFTCQKYKYGGMYFLQAFTFGREVDLSEVPVFIDGSEPRITEKIKEVAGSVSKNVHPISHKERKVLHLASVWAGSFSNHMVATAFGILREHNLPVEWLHPLVRETCENALATGPENVQDGPAVRQDELTIKKHLDLLSYSPELQQLYRLVSGSILDRQDEF